MLVNPPKAKVHNHRRGGRGTHMGDVVDWHSLILFSAVLLGTRTADAERSSLTYYTSVDAVWAMVVPFGGLINSSHSMRELPQNPINVGKMNGDFQLKRLPAHFGSE
jgi:hypothetical protein